MSKTFTEIGLIIGGLALAAIPGLQMLGLIAIEGHAALLSAMLGIGVSTALSGVGVALRPAPTKPVGTANQVSFNQGPAPRRVIYGQFQTAGVLTYASFPPAENQNVDQQRLHLVYTLTGHQISSFDAICINGSIYNFGSDLIWNGTYWVLKPANSSTLSDFYWLSLEMTFDCGNPANTTQAFPELGAVDSGWTSAFMQRGCAKVHVVLSASQGWPYVFPNGSIPNIQFLVTGKKLTDPRVINTWQGSTTYHQYTYIVDNHGVVWFQQTSGNPSSGGTRPNFEANDSAATTLTDGGCTWYSTGTGLAFWLTGNFPNNPPQLAFTPGSLGAGILLNDTWAPGATYGSGALQTVIEAPIGYLQLLTTAGSTGSAHPLFATAVGSTTTDNAATWTCMGRSPHALNPSNCALVVNDYLQDADAGLGVAASTIDSASVIAAANVCEEQELIIWNADNTVVYENLYSCNGMFDHSSNRGDVLTSLCGSMAGWVISPGDLWHVFAGAYVTPLATVTDNDLRGPIKGDFRLSKRDVANSVKGRYIPAFLPSNPGAALSMVQVPAAWQTQSFPSYQANGLAGKPNYLNSEDSGQVIWQDIQLDFTTSLWTAQRLAKITLMRLRFQQTVTLACKMTAFQIEAGDTFGFVHSRWNMNDTVFLADQVTITIEAGAGQDQAPVIGVDIVGRQTDPSVYTFTAPTSSSNFGEYSPYGITGVMTGVE
jgi:hypothetical protein